MVEVEKFYDQQPYLSCLFETIYSTAYFSLLRIGEIAKSPHMILARNTHIGVNKNKILFILTSSKTHTKGDHPQKVKITSTPTRRAYNHTRHCCPFTLLKQYIAARPQSKSDEEQFFIFSDNTSITPAHIYSNFKTIIIRLGFDPVNYCFHSL